MSIRLSAALAFACIVAFSTQSAEAPYYKNVSDIEVEAGVKGETYDKGPVNYFEGKSGGGHHSSDKECCRCACVSDNAVSATTPVADGAQTVQPVHPVPAPPDNSAKIKAAIQLLGTSGWQDAQTLIVSFGKESVPHLIDALSSSEPAYNAGGHTKADAPRTVRQRSIGEVCAELLMDIVENHSSYKGDLPALDQAAWREWWSKNGESVTFAAN